MSVGAAIVVALAGCGPGTPPTSTIAPSTATIAPSTATSAPSTATPSTATIPTGTGTNGATAAPSWLGSRVLRTGSDEARPRTPRELRDRRIITVDRLAPPADGRFHSRIRQVPVDVLDRSTWSTGCPVGVDQLRYVNVSFRGFDGRAHTGELLVNRSVAADVVTVFERLFAAGWPIEEMRITSQADFSAPPTGDGNDTSAFACRAVRGATSWSQHAYGLAIDVNPFQNPYLAGRTLLPELAGSYTDRAPGRPGMNTPTSLPVRAFRSVGWGWGGTYSAKKDWMHFSSTGK